jgi:signal peptide peptidase SppA
MDTPTFHRQLVVIGAVVFAAAVIGSSIAVVLMGGSPSEDTSFYSSSCNVLQVKIHGEIYSTGSEMGGYGPGGLYASSSADEASYTIAADVASAVLAARDDDNIKGMIIDVDSPGGGAEAGTEIAHAIRLFGKPSVSVIHEIGASSGYLSAAAADTVFAADASTVGSIGVTSSYLNYSKKDAQDGITYETLSSGPFKDTFSPDKPLTAAERMLIMRDIQIARDHFVTLVASYRHLPTSTVDKLADGSTVMGTQAKENGLIDQIGFTDDATSYLTDKIGEPVVICE